MRLELEPHTGFWARDEHGRLWTCSTRTVPQVRFPHWPITTTTHWYLAPGHRPPAVVGERQPGT